MVETTVWFLVSEALSNAIKHAGATELRVERRPARRTLVAEVADDGAGGACETRGTGLQGLAARVESLGGRLTSRARPARARACWPPSRSPPGAPPREPFLEFGHDGDGGRGARSIDELFGGQRPARSRSRASGSSRAARRGSASACRCSTTRAATTAPSRSSASAVLPFGDVDPETIDAEPGSPTGTRGRRQAYDECRAEIAALLGDPDWRLADTEPMVILWYRLVDQPTAAAEISGSTL